MGFWKTALAIATGMTIFAGAVLGGLAVYQHHQDVQNAHAAARAAEQRRLDEQLRQVHLEAAQEEQAREDAAMEAHAEKVRRAARRQAAQFNRRQQAALDAGCAQTDSCP